MRLLFSFKGRIGRAKFWLGALGTGVIWTLLFGFIFATMGPIEPAPGQQMQIPAAAIIAMAIVYIPMLWISLALTIKRGHDRGRSAWWQLLALVPFFNIWLFVDQGFFRGADEANEWGPPDVRHSKPGMAS